MDVQKIAACLGVIRRCLEIASMAKMVFGVVKIFQSSAVKFCPADILSSTSSNFPMSNDRGKNQQKSCFRKEVSNDLKPALLFLFARRRGFGMERGVHGPTLNRTMRRWEEAQRVLCKVLSLVRGRLILENRQCIRNSSFRESGSRRTRPAGSRVPESSFAPKFAARGTRRRSKGTEARTRRVLRPRKCSKPAISDPANEAIRARNRQRPVPRKPRRRESKPTKGRSQSPTRSSTLGGGNVLCEFASGGFSTLDTRIRTRNRRARLSQKREFSSRARRRRTGIVCEKKSRRGFLSFWKWKRTYWVVSAL